MDRPTVKNRIIVHLSQYSRYSRDYVCPQAVTQQGMSETLGLTQAHVSGELKKLIEGNVVECDVRHVKTSRIKKNVYFLKPRGENAAKKIKEAMPMEMFDLRADVAIREHMESQESDNLDFLTP